ncbi:OadG family transporter subunit [Pelodictyon luteolum]|uniref:Sodium pump decarboxylase, gamma subunit n=1 Tax=Chlorobium luteolum (strain DSM 273 / BCRC 81028 / 2530) TaxID=319225 RepID=Q3B3F1_CHLL3|nr:OadG family transporter subunit [Pelodictyon luteolum]ABB24130.1 Sodium pump decarboxylase, gamma subunit [Pelodictyon luteolum DSM 273]
MAFDGVILMVVGMLTVYVFIMLMIMMIKILSNVFRTHALDEEKSILDEIESKRRKKREKDMKKAAATMGTAGDAARMTAVITAAVHAHAARQS